jgi:hypothetical protein
VFGSIANAHAVTDQVGAGDFKVIEQRSHISNRWEPTRVQGGC